MNIFEKKAVEKIWWYGLNILTTLLIISLVNVNGPKGDQGLPGLDGEGATITYPVTALSYDKAPTGTARAAYVQSLVQKGYIPLSSVEDFSIFSTSPDLSTDAFAVGNEDAYANKKYVLTADIDFTGLDTRQDQNYIVPEIVTEDGRDYIAFEGIFDGAGYTIKNFSSERGEYDLAVGFFPYTSYAQIKNINFENIRTTSVLSWDSSTGVVVGKVEGPTLIQNVSIKNSISVNDSTAGGVVGFAQDDIFLLNVKTENVIVGASDNAGGFIGKTEDNYLINIQDSVSDSVINYALLDEDFKEYVSEYDYAGGFIAQVENAESVIILNSAHIGTVIVDNEEVGGFIGYIQDSQLTVVANSFNSGFVQSFGAEAGGLIGDNNSESPFYIQNSFNAGQVYATSGSVGGLVGEIGDLDEEDYIQFAPIYITNSYNAGHISAAEYSDEKGGLVGEVDSDRHLVISNSFNVGTFSLAITSHDDQYPLFADNGALVGDTSGIVTLVNVAFYVDEANPTLYLNHALDRSLAADVTRYTTLNSFTKANFVFNGTWNLSTIWTFNTTGYAFPVLRHLPTFTVDAVQSFAPYINYAEVWNMYDSFDVELNATVIVVDYLYLEYGDAETAEEDLDVKIYALLEETEDLETIQNGDVAKVIDQDFFYEDSSEGLFVYQPTLGDGTYYFYLVVVDNDGLATFRFIIDFVYVDSSNASPIPGNDGAFTAEFENYDLTSLLVTFTGATDDLTDVDDLVYTLVITVDGFDFANWNYNVDANGILYSTSLVTPGNLNVLDIASANLSYGITYNVNIVVDDGTNISSYTVLDIINLD